MKSICYIIPYFGKLPNNFQIWLDSCKENSTIDWILFSDSIEKFSYPSNVKKIFFSFEKFKTIIQENYNFKIYIDKPWRLSYFKPAYGEIFQKYITGYDYWGHCDIDLIWGDIREFIKDDILNNYDRIGFQGHSTIYKNMPVVNARYKTIVPGKINYIDIFSGKKDYSFDENGMDDIYNFLNVKFYNETNFAHLSKYDYSFYLKYLPKDDDYKNYRQIFTWKNGKLERLYIEKNEIKSQEFMYLHFFCRPIKFKVTELEENKNYVIYPDVFTIGPDPVDAHFIKKYGKNSKVKYYVTSFIYNRKKLTPKRIINNIKNMIKYKKTKNK